MGKLVTGKQLIQLLKKYKFALIVVCLGLLLMWIPGRESTSARQVKQTETIPAEENLTGKLEQILSAIQGAGEVKVLLSESRGEKIVYQTDISGTGEFRVEAEIKLPEAYKGVVYELGTYYIQVVKK